MGNVLKNINQCAQVGSEWERHDLTVLTILGLKDLHSAEHREINSAEIIN